MATRREFLAGSMVSAFALAGSVSHSPFPLRRGASSGSNRSLLIIHLRGGNDGLNTVVPYASKNYYRARPDISIPAQTVLRLDGMHGLHPALEGLFRLYKQDKVAIFLNSGCDGLTKSHHRATEIWQTGRANEIGGPSWLERVSLAMDSLRDGRTLKTKTTGTTTTTTTTEQLTSISSTDSTAGGYEKAMSDVASIIEENSGPFAFQVVLDGFDTHVNQNKVHGDVLAKFADELDRLYKRLSRTSNQDRLLTFVYSEFGRSINQNADLGTDHGASGPCFLIGSNVTSTIHGTYGFYDFSIVRELPVANDIQKIYTNVLSNWLPERTLPGLHEHG